MIYSKLLQTFLRQLSTKLNEIFCAYIKYNEKCGSGGFFQKFLTFSKLGMIMLQIVQSNSISATTTQQHHFQATFKTSLRPRLKHNSRQPKFVYIGVCAIRKRMTTWLFLMTKTAQNSAFDDCLNRTVLFILLLNDYDRSVPKQHLRIYLYFQFCKCLHYNPSI